jgi:hypothetical protein
MPSGLVHPTRTISSAPSSEMLHFHLHLNKALVIFVICKDDNGRRRPNYSAILRRHGCRGYFISLPVQQATVLEPDYSSKTLIKFGENSIADVFQDFIIPKCNHIFDIASRSSYKGTDFATGRC